MCLALLVSTAAMLKLLILKVPVLIYAIDRVSSQFSKSDARLDPVYEAVFKKDLKFVEGFHTVLDKRFLENLFKRSRVALYIKAIDALFPAARMLGKTLAVEEVVWHRSDLSIFSSEEEIFVQKIVSKYLSQIPLVEFRVRALAYILKRSKLSTILAIDNTRDYWELVLGAQLAAVPVCAFQHGHYTKYHVGWLNKGGEFTGTIVRPSRLYVWSNFWKSELIRLGTYWSPEEIFVGGAKEKMAAPLPKNSSEGFITVVVPYEVDSNKVEVKQYIDALLNCPKVRVVFKARGDMSIDSQLEASLLSRQYHERFSFTEDTKKAIKQGDIFAGTYSTLLYDMIMFEKPILYFKTSSDFGEGLVINGLAEGIELSEVTQQRLESIAQTDAATLIKRKERLYSPLEMIMAGSVMDAI
ncbi:hypothetical protein KW785_00525 [Candidatus Parcubacteria bacterium]|nr:hypothetical protein [Candidatus Parcubacteria bacterium]